MKPWYKQRTAIAGIGVILATIGGYMQGEISLIPAIIGVLSGAAAVYGRDAIEKNGAAAVVDAIKKDPAIAAVISEPMKKIGG